MNGGHGQERAESQGQFTGIDDFIVRCYLNGAHVDAIEAPARLNHPGFDVAVLNCLQELKIRPTWTALSGLK